MMSDIDLLKKEQRKKLTLKRKELINNKVVFDSKNLDNLFLKKDFIHVKIIASFFSIKTEIPTFKLNTYLASKNKILTFPIVDIIEKKLLFREYKKNQNLIKGKFQIPEPPKNNNNFIPSLFFVPCLGFDEHGYRLGYGGGFYDRTFSYYKNIKHKFITIGYAYDQQKVKKVFRDKLDYKLDYVLTEKKLYSFV